MLVFTSRRGAGSLTTVNRSVVFFLVVGELVVAVPQYNQVQVETRPLHSEAVIALTI